MRKTLIVACVCAILLCVIVKLAGGGELISTYVESVAHRAAAEMYAAEAEYEERLEDRLRAEGEKQLKIAEGNAIEWPARAAAFSVYVQSLLVVFWNMLIPTGFVLYLIGKLLYPLAVAMRDKAKRKYVMPTIELQNK